MIDRADIALLSAVAMTLGIGYAALRLSLRGQFAKMQKYRLFKVRDELIYLVATGKLREEDFVFQLFYGATNYWINQTNGINLRAMLKARVEGLDPAEKAKLEKTHMALATKDKDVKDAVSDFYVSMLTILRENSWPLRLLLLVHPLLKALGTFARGIRKFAPSVRKSAPLQAYEVYRDYETAAMAA